MTARLALRRNDGDLFIFLLGHLCWMVPFNIQPVVVVRGLKRQQILLDAFFLALSYFFFLSFGAE